MYSFVLQDWTTIAGTSTNNVIQTEDDWLDMSPFQDVVVWLDVKNVTGSPAPQIFFETAPSKDDRLFVSLGAAITLVATPTTPNVIQYLMGSASVPIAECLRWRMSGTIGTTWDATFRVLVAANAPGLQPEDMNKQLLMMGR